MGVEWIERNFCWECWSVEGRVFCCFGWSKNVVFYRRIWEEVLSGIWCFEGIVCYRILKWNGKF